MVVYFQATAWLAVAVLAILTAIYFAMMVAFCVRMARKGRSSSRVGENGTAEEKAPLFE